MSRWRWLITALSFALMIGASAWVVASNGPITSMPVLAWRAHAAALLAVALEVATRAFKMRASAIAVGLSLRYTTALRACLGGDFAAAITPARSGAEPARFLVLAESGMSASGRVLVLFLELLLELCSLALVCGALAWMFHGRGSSVRGLMALVGGYSVAVLGVGAIAFVMARRDPRASPPAWLARAGLQPSLWRGLQSTFRSFRASVDSLRNANVAVMGVAFVSSVLHVLLKVVTLPLLVFFGDPAFPRSMDTLAPLVLWPLALFYGGVVVPAPGGGGFIEGAFAVTLKSAIPASIFAASLLWWRFYTFYLYIIVGGLAVGDAALRALRQRAHEAPPQAEGAP